MRGPISINGHIGQLQRPSMRRALSMISVYSEPEDKSSLLNPDSNDGCWDILFMICGGTGITPMIQLIEYHIEKGKRRNIKLFLLFANNSESDIILYPNGLNELMSRSDGKLQISFALSHPPSGWSHYQRLNYDVIFDWMSKNYIPNDNDNITIIQSSIMNGQTSFSSTLNTGISSTKQPEQQNQSIYEPTKYIEALKNDPVALKVMVCGPHPMILSVSNVLNKLNFPEDKVIIIN
ncbi:hypothetical protein C1645_305723 [Glomus cerebriforme]|uniref:Oxidoreductase FAD/NAD(P)-binding domain-containing protein n=1 Tax=Glomus cerebriforme TaxID=658196 RepID=A0A397TJM7_9GLOM|nr:hypothetical protein C1645_305723 [Glomus cerebriforme]